MRRAFEVSCEEIRQVRLALGLSQREFAGRLGILNAQNISDAEVGRHGLNPTALMLIAQWREELIAEGKLNGTA